ncbi:MAG TPA: twin-arginine translocase subunit TatC [Bacillota bacterium]|nr:twin-arginine translocase subunit TatC [Bacillota bacterium]
MSSQKEMNIVEHLSELRNRLIVTAVFFILFFIVGFIFAKDVYFFFKEDIDFPLHITGITDTLRIYVKIATIIALVGTIPVFSIQLWLFVKPGLTETERKASLKYIPAVVILFIVGLIFGYLIFVNFIMPFLISLNDDMFTEIFTVEKYFGFLFKIVLPFAFIFEIPVLSMFLTSLGLLSPAALRKFRKYAYFVLLILGGIITPPDIFLQLIVAIPLFLLYEVSIYTARIAERNRERREEKAMQSLS